jgi:hypothetical protein
MGVDTVDDSEGTPKNGPERTIPVPERALVPPERRRPRPAPAVAPPKRKRVIVAGVLEAVFDAVGAGDGGGIGEPPPVDPRFIGVPGTRYLDVRIRWSDGRFSFLGESIPAPRREFVDGPPTAEAAPTTELADAQVVDSAPKDPNAGRVAVDVVYADPGIVRALEALAGNGFRPTTAQGRTFVLRAGFAWETMAFAGVKVLEAAGYKVRFGDRYPTLREARAIIETTLRAADADPTEPETGGRSDARAAREWFVPQVSIRILAEDGGTAAESLDFAEILPDLRRVFLATPPEAVHLVVRVGAATVSFRRTDVELLFETLVELLDGAMPKAVPRVRAAQIAASYGGKHPSLDKLRGLLKARASGITAEVAAPEGLGTTLRPYQLAGYAFLRSAVDAGFGAILADAMGLGKTVQALALLLALHRAALAKGKKESDRARFLVVAPKSVVPVWAAEARRFTPSLRVHVHDGKGRHALAEDLEAADLVITSYPLVARDAALAGMKFRVVVLDEAQMLKNPGAKTREALLAIAADVRIALTGTPLENRLADLWSLVDLTVPGLLGDPKAFAKLVERPVVLADDRDRLRWLHRRLSPFLLRRGKDAVAGELPPKTLVRIPVILGAAQRSLYEGIRLTMETKVRDAMAASGLKRSSIVVLDALLKLRQVCCDPSLVKTAAARRVAESAKREAIVEHLETFVSEGRRTVVFSQFTSYLDLLAEDLTARGLPFERLQGDTKDRAAPVLRFQAGETPIFLVSLRAGGTGLTLTAADTVIHCDPWWNPAVEDQATDRTHRIGQDKNVIVYRFVVQGTVEEKLLELQDKKRRLAAGVLGDPTGDGTDDPSGAARFGSLAGLDDREVLELFAPIAE